MRIIFLFFVFFISLPVFSYENLSGKKLLCSDTLAEEDANKSNILGFDFVDKSKAEIIYTSFIPELEWESIYKYQSVYQATLNKITIESQESYHKYSIKRETLDVSIFGDVSPIYNCYVVDDLFEHKNLYQYILFSHENEKERLIKKFIKKNKI